MDRVALAAAFPPNPNCPGNQVRLPELFTAGILRKTNHVGTKQLHLDPTLTFRGRHADHLAVLQGDRIPAPADAGSRPSPTACASSTTPP